MKKRFDIQLRIAIDKYGDDHVDILVEGNGAYGTYHSDKDSFPVTDTFMLINLGGIDTLKQYESEFENLCICND